MTLDKLAGLVNKGFENTATKADITAVRSEIAGVKDEVKGEITVVREELEAVKTELKDDIRALHSEMESGLEKINRERNYGVEIDALRASVIQIKQHLGIQN